MSKHAHAVFDYCTFWDFDVVEKAAIAGNCKSRICFVTTQEFRLYLNLDARTLYFTAYVKGENCWEQIAVSESVTPPEMVKMLRTPATLKSGAIEAFFQQFPKAEESFYKNLPTYEVVMSLLSVKPTGETIESNFFIYSRDEETAVDGATGVVTITVEEGELMIPYDAPVDGDDGYITLQLERHKLHPDNKIAYAVDKFLTGVEDIGRAITSHGWSDFRRLIDRI